MGATEAKHAIVSNLRKRMELINRHAVTALLDEIYLAAGDSQREGFEFPKPLEPKCTPLDERPALYSNTDGVYSMNGDLIADSPEERLAYKVYQDLAPKISTVREEARPAVLNALRKALESEGLRFGKEPLVSGAQPKGLLGRWTAFARSKPELESSAQR